MNYIIYADKIYLLVKLFNNMVNIYIYIYILNFKKIYLLFNFIKLNNHVKLFNQYKNHIIEQ
jgi:hypothetical protein